MPAHFFVTGTDTAVGKTCVSIALIHAANDRGLTTAALKPVAAGCEQTAQGLRNDDAVALQRAITIPLTYAQINPVALAPPMAPHVAAEQVQRRISIDRLSGFCRGVLIQAADFVIIEGAGGWRVPINDRETLADLPRALSLPIILVVGMRLGCLNHALLTAEAIVRDGLAIAGWVANGIDATMPAYSECIETLERLLPAPCLGHIPFMPNPQTIAMQRHIDIDKLLI